MTQRLAASMTELAGFLLRPRAIAVVGASPEPQRIGGQPVRALREFGYAGGVYPVNPKYTELQGLVCYADIAQVPTPCDIALICVPAAAVAASIRACGNAGIPVAVVLSAGFREIGDAGMALQAELDSAIAQSGVRVIGPNCQGMLSPVGAVYCGFGAPFMVAHEATGEVAMVTQSGGFGYAVMGLSEAEGVGFNHVVSTGNEADVTTLDLIELFLEDASTRMIAVYMEGIQDGRRLAALGQRALQVDKPILVWKVGNSATGRAAAASHTANLSAPAELYRMAFRQGGFVELSDVADLVDVTRAFASPRRPRGNRVAVISISGGAGVLFADLCDAHRLSLPALSEQTCTVLREVLPSFSSLLNPVDVTAQIFNDFSIFKRVVEAVAADPVIDQVVVVMASVAGANAARIASEMAEIVRVSTTPISVVSSALPERAASAREIFASAGIPVYATPGRAALAISAVTDFETRRRASCLPLRGESARPPQVSPSLLAHLSGTLDERRSKDLAQACGLQVVEEVILEIQDVHTGRLPVLSWPAVVKLVSADLPHKTEAGAVRVGVSTVQGLQQAVSEMLASARCFAPDARIDGVSVQRMASGIEMIIGTVRDPYFGPVVLVGLGGTMAELFRDVVMRFAPVSESEAMEMIHETRAWTLLKGYRGGPAADVDALAAAVSRISWFAADHQNRVSEIDINPIFVGPAGQGAWVADALVVLDEVRLSRGTTVGESIR
jgi:acyl-CoA synthetase (NDP forming)